MVQKDKQPEQTKISIDPSKTSSSFTSSSSSRRSYSCFYYLLTSLTLWWRGVLDSIGNIISFFTCRLFNHHRWAVLPDDLSGQTVVITGANGGLGKETARAAARRGARVIFACRNEETTAQVIEEIASQEEGVKPENLVFVRLDLSSLASVRNAATEINECCDRIDVLINNGGVMMCPKWTTVDGHEYQMGTNYLGHFLLTILLLEKIKKSSFGGRIVNVASIAYMMGRPWFEDLNLDRKGVYNSLRSYSRSKLYQMLSMSYMSKRLKEEGSKVKLYALHPGVVDTGIVKHFNFCLRGLVSVFHRMVMVTPEIGSQTTLHCAFSEEAGNEETGGYYENCRRLKIPPHATDLTDAAYLWELSCRLCSLVDNNNLI